MANIGVAILDLVEHMGSKMVIFTFYIISISVIVSRDNRVIVHHRELDKSICFVLL